MELQKKEGSESGPLLDFVNYIAHEVGKVYQNVPSCFSVVDSNDFITSLRETAYELFYL